MRVFHRMKRALATLATLSFLSLALSAGSCGGGGTMMPSPSPTATPPQPGGPVTGSYLVQITPSNSCAMAHTPLTFLVRGAPAGTQPHPGVQVLLVGNDGVLEMELLSTGVALRGGVGTLNDFGALSRENARVLVHGIASGLVFGASDGRGQIVSGGTLSGFVGLQSPGSDEPDLGSCTATDHGFALRAQ